ncbi:cation efflux protein [Piedraia hortae CBS 480.64]|uniref:Cation efflux protein n=1 Tax=Piedraia hortae CBS 480.64 TaxID=1314780 RepID=A0A6A7C0X8_9PEZI|nr:cation efflux protein [Piedraia hortae CBS 480.64]
MIKKRKERTEKNSNITTSPSTTHSLHGAMSRSSRSSVDGSAITAPTSVHSRTSPGTNPSLYTHKARTQSTDTLWELSEYIRLAEQPKGPQYYAAVYSSLIANIGIAGLSIYVSYGTGSLTFLATATDSLCDPLSNVALVICAIATKKQNRSKYPAGNARIETIGNITFAWVMVIVSIVLITVSLIQIITGTERDLGMPLDLFFVIVMGGSCAVKIVLAIYCFVLRFAYPQVGLLWQDHRNDALVNIFAFFTILFAARLAWWVDPLGAIVISLATNFIWSHHIWKEYQLVLGRAADPVFARFVRLVARRQGPPILGVLSVLAWYYGPGLVVKVEVEVDSTVSLAEGVRATNDLEVELKKLPDVEWCDVRIAEEWL